MAELELKGEQRVFMTGNEVCAWAAIAAKADVMYGYPITPQNEIMHYWTRLAPKYGKTFLQTEDEISAGFTSLGGCMVGKKTFTATAGPGNVLMQESAVMAEMMRIPVVYIIQQRGGPSTATVIYAQQEVNMTTFGGNGEGFRIVYSTAGHQDLFDYTIKAFNMAWKYRFPAFVLGDGYQAKMREPVTLYDPVEKGIELVAAEATLGNTEPGKQYVNMRNCLSVEEELDDIMQIHLKDYAEMASEIVEWDEQMIDDADIVLIAHGVVSRATLRAMKALREEGMKIGYFRPITLRPFPGDALRAVAKKAKKLFVTESAQGQLLRLVKEELCGEFVGEIATYLRPGVGITTEEVIEQVKNIKL